MTVRTFAVFYLAAQAVGGAAWWALLFTWPESRAYFRPGDAPDSTLLAFACPDLLLYAALSGVVAWGLVRERDWGWPLLCVHAGAATYAGLYCWGLVVASGGEALTGAVLMTPSLFVPGWLAWTLRPGGSASC